jgi:C4-dicarboxylate-specific signal transduction histidine kinase
MIKMRLMENPFPVETVRRRKNGMLVPVSLICVPLPSSRAANAGYLIYRDISEAKRLQDEQRRYHEIQLELAQANRASTLGLLSASIAHELNQPLSGIITNCEVSLRMLARDPENVNGVQEAMRRAIRDGQRASEVVARLRALFNKKQPELEPVDLNEAAGEVIGLSLGEIKNNRIFVQTDFAEGLQRIMADRVQLQQVILNLFRNALDAMSTVHDRPRSLIIRTEREEGDSLRLSVKDVGVGFDPGAAEKLFDAFYSTKHDGMGVGLSMSNFIVKSHQGRLWAGLNDGPGATFSFSIPYERSK